MTIANGQDSEALDHAVAQAVATIEARGRELAAEMAARASLAVGDKAVLVDAVTKERAHWRSELREVASRLVAHLRASGGGQQLPFAEVHRLRAEIVLRLNPVGRPGTELEPGRHELDRELHLILDGLWSDDGTPKPEHIDLAAALEHAVQRLLKQEWTVSKKEAVDGVLAP